jgi:hypothetical protein
MLHPERVDEATAADLVAAGKWSPLPDGCYQVVAWERTQSPAVDVEWQHERNRQKVGAFRERERQKSTDVTGYVTGYPGGEARKGEERRGEARRGEARRGKASTHRTTLVLAPATNSKPAGRRTGIATPSGLPGTVPHDRL